MKKTMAMSKVLSLSMGTLYSIACSTTENNDDTKNYPINISRRGRRAEQNRWLQKETNLLSTTSSCVFFSSLFEWTHDAYTHIKTILSMVTIDAQQSKRRNKNANNGWRKMKGLEREKQARKI